MYSMAHGQERRPCLVRPFKPDRDLIRLDKKSICKSMIIRP